MERGHYGSVAIWHLAHSRSEVVERSIRLSGLPRLLPTLHNVYNENGSLMQKGCRYYVNKIVRLICSYDVFIVPTSKGYKNVICLHY